MIALGKAAGDMALVALGQIAVDCGLVVVPRGGVPPAFRAPPHVEVITASHPVPDSESFRAGLAALTLAETLGPDDRLLVLLSGGGSSLMTVPRHPLTLADLIAVNDALLRSGAPISVINTIRRAVCEVKGGGLAAAAGSAEVITLVLSDVPGDDVTAVASGPTAADHSGDGWRARAAGLGIAIPAVPDRLARQTGPNVQTPRLVGSAAISLAAMARTAQGLGFTPILLGDNLEGDAVDLAQHHAALAIEQAMIGKPTALISGGETSVAITGTSGRGGRNQTYALALAIALRGHPAIHALAGDSDGIDGNSPLAGAMIFPDTLARCRNRGCDPAQMLASHDTTSAFELLGDGLSTGPTFTNVNDLRAILVGAPG